MKRIVISGITALALTLGFSTQAFASDQTDLTKAVVQLIKKYNELELSLKSDSETRTRLQTTHNAEMTKQMNELKAKLQGTVDKLSNLDQEFKIEKEKNSVQAFDSVPMPPMKGPTVKIERAPEIVTTEISGSKSKKNTNDTKSSNTSKHTTKQDDLSKRVEVLEEEMFKLKKRVSELEKSDCKPKKVLCEDLTSSKKVEKKVKEAVKKVAEKPTKSDQTTYDQIISDFINQK